MTVWGGWNALALQASVGMLQSGCTTMPHLTVRSPVSTIRRWGRLPERCRRVHAARQKLPEPGNPIAWNRYAYVYNSPFNYTDPSGHNPLALGLGALAVVDAVWDGGDSLGYAMDCFGDNSSIACYAMAGAGLMMAIPGDGPGDNAARRILIVGENSFEYADNLYKKFAKEGLSVNIVATSLESADELIDLGFSIPNNRPGFTVRHGVDARYLERSFPDEVFDAIIFNNPHAGSGAGTADLIEGFIASGRGRLAPGGGIHINVTQKLIQNHSEVAQVFGLSGFSDYQLGRLPRFGQSPYYAPYLAYYTKGVPMKRYGWDASQAQWLLNRVFE